MLLKISSFLGYLFMILGALGLFFTKTLFSAFIPSVLIQIFAVFLMVWARITFGTRSFHLVANPTEGGLVTTGPYRFIRHPIYTSVCLFVVASFFNSFSLNTIILVLLVFVGSIIRIFCEEHFLLKKYSEYRDYSKNTKRMISLVF